MSCVRRLEHGSSAIRLPLHVTRAPPLAGRRAAPARPSYIQAEFDEDVKEEEIARSAQPEDADTDSDSDEEYHQDHEASGAGADGEEGEEAEDEIEYDEDFDEGDGGEPLGDAEWAEALAAGSPAVRQRHAIPLETLPYRAEIALRGHYHPVLRAFVSILPHRALERSSVAYMPRHIKKFTVLKSPLGHSKARAQFEVRTHKIVLNVATASEYKMFRFLQVVKNNLGPIETKIVFDYSPKASAAALERAGAAARRQEADA